MKNFYYFILLYILSSINFSFSQSSTIYITSSGGTYPTEKWISISTEPNHSGIIIWAQGNGTIGNASGYITDQAVTINNGQTYYINCFDKYADGWDGTKYTITSSTGGGGILIANNNGISPNGNGNTDASSGWDATIDELETSEAFSYTPPSCSPTSVLSSSNITANSADLAWTDNNTVAPAGGWQIEYGVSGFVQGTGTKMMASTNPYTLTGLTQNTTYQYYVRAICGASDTSAWSSISSSFTTLCAIIIPDYTQSFDSWVLSCWEEAGNGYISTGPTSIGSADWISSTIFGNDVKINLYDKVDREWALSPYFNLSIGGYEILLDVAVTNYNSNTSGVMGSDDSVSLLYTVDGTTWNELKTWMATDNLSNTLTTFKYNLSTTGNNVRFAIRASDGTIKNTEDYDFHFDNFIVRTPPTCFLPTVLSSSNITANTAQLSWTDNNTVAPARGWQIEYGVSGFVQGTGTKVMSSTNPYTLTGLTQNTSYKYYVRAICGAGDTSAWSSLSSSFTTLYSCPKPTLPLSSNITDNQATLNWTENSTGTSWEIEYGTYISFTYTKLQTISNITTQPYILSGLSENTTYQYKLRTICGVGDTSLWSTFSSSFKTLCDTIIPDYTQSFDSWVLSCWEEAGNGYISTGPTSIGSADWNSSTIFGNDVKINLFESVDREWALSPYFNLSIGGYEILLDVAVTNYNSNTSDVMGSDDSVSLLYTEDGITWKELKTWMATDNLSNTLTTFKYNLSTTGNNVRFAIRASDGSIQNTEDYDFHFDNFIVRKPPTCFLPTVLSSSNITANTAQLSWTDNNTSAPSGGWQIEYGVSGFVQGTGTKVMSSTNPYTLTGLTQNTSYKYYVRAICGVGDTSAWSSISSSFTTLYSCPKPTLPLSSNITDNQATLNWTENSIGTSWEFEYGTYISFTYTKLQTISNITTQPYILSGLSENTTYQYKLRTICGVGDTSLWSTFSSSFKTLCDTIIPDYTQSFDSWVLSCWEEAGNGYISTGPTSIGSADWISSTIFGNDVKINLLSNVDREWALSPYFDLSAGVYEILVDVAVTNYSSNTSDVMGSDDSVSLLYTVDGTTWNELKTWMATDNLSNTLTTFKYNLSTTGNNVRFAIRASDGTIDNAEDYDFHFDNFIVRTPPTCFLPTVLSSSNITANTAQLSWTDNNTVAPARGWQIEYGVSGFVQGTGTKVMSSTNPYTLTGLTQNTSYKYYVRAICGIGDTSAWSSISSSFTTLCAIIIPDYTQSFDSWVSSCWEEAGNGYISTGPTSIGSADWNSSTIFGNDVKINLYSNVDREWALSPYFNLSIGGYEILLDVAVTNINSNTSDVMGSDDSVSLLYTEDGITWNELKTWMATDNLSNTLTTFKYNLSTTGNNVRFAIRASDGTIDNAEDYDFHFDNFIVKSRPSCSSPTVLISSDITANTAQLSWTDNNTAAPAGGWQIEYGVSGFVQGTGTKVMASTNPYTLTGLTQNTSYKYYVRAICSAGDTSAWSSISSSIKTLFDPCSEIFISEYVEGSSNNKALELYNPTSNNINLNNYKLKLYTNGSTTPTNYTLIGNVLPHDVFVIVNSSASSNLLALKDTSFSIAFSGNDALVLEKTDGTIIDIIGNIGQNLVWSNNGVSTQDNTLVRKQTVNQGRNTNGIFDPSIEWDSYIIDTYTKLGSHNNIACCVNSSSSVDTTVCDSYTWSQNSMTYTTSGSYKDTLMNSVGCDSIITLNLTIKNSTSSSVDTTVCDSYTWVLNNMTYTTSGSYKDTLSNSVGCDSIITLNLTIKNSTSSSLVTTVCNSYIWSLNNMTYTTSGAYKDTLMNSVGCDSIITLNLTIKNSTSSSVDTTVCNSYIWSLNNMTYTSSGSYKDTLMNSVGCDSIITLNLTILKSGYDTLDTIVCSKYISITGKIYTISGLYNDTLISNNCNSYLTTKLLIKTSTSSNIDISACNTYTWSLNNMTYTTSGSYKDTLTNSVGCDSIITLNLTINNSTSSSVDTTVCDSYTWSLNNMTYTTSGVYKDTLTNSAGCDSIITLNLTIKNSTSSSVDTTVCDSYTWLLNNMTYTTSGIYKDTIPSSVGCDSIITLNLTILKSGYDTLDTIVCSKYISITGKIYTISGLYNDTLISNNCNSYLTTKLLIKNSTSSNIDISACNTFTWSSNSMTYTTSGAYKDTLTNSVGCDSVVTLNLTINNSTSSSVDTTVCDSYTWSLNNMTYSTSGAYKDTLMNSVGCDSIITLNLTIKNSTSSSVDTTVCNSYIWSLNNMTYTTSGAYKDTLMNSVGCDSIITLKLTILKSGYDTLDTIVCSKYISITGKIYTISGLYNDTLISNNCNSYLTTKLLIKNSTSSNIDISACNTYTWSLNSMTYTTSGVYKDTLTNSVGCDSVVTLNLTINNSTSSSVDTTVCDSYTWSLNNMTYTISGIYKDTIPNSVGCDSIITMNLKIKTSTSSSVEVSISNSYTWSLNNMTYTTSGVYKDTIPNSVGCDSIITLNLTINNSTSSSVDTTVCDSYTWLLNNMTYTTSGIYKDTLPNSIGSDSIITLNLTIKNSTSSTISASTCNTYTWSLNSMTYTTSGAYKDTISNSVGCDSIITLNLKINNSTSSSVDTTVCDSYTWSLNSMTYTTSGSYKDTLMNSVGCDSIITLNLTINNSTSSSIDTTVCNSYIWSLNNMTYTTSGSYKDTLMNSVGCDSIITLNLTINNSTSSTIIVSACNSYTWSLNSMTYTTSGSYKDTLMNTVGCDSIITLNLTIKNSTSSTISASACNSYTWSLNSMTYTTSGSYKDTLMNSVGCDSVVTLNLTIKNSTSSTISVSACNSYTWSLNNMTYTTSGSYKDTLMNSVGCDSIITLNLTIKNSTSSTISVSACNSYTWSLNSMTYTTSGSYKDTLMNSVGCDSIITLNLTIKNSTSSTISASACNSYTWSLNSMTYTTSGSYKDTLMNSVGCDSVVTLNLTIKNSTSSTISVSACNSYTWSLNSMTYTTSGSYKDTLMNSAGCDSIITLNLIINNSTSSTISVSACNSYTWSLNSMTYTTSGSYKDTLMNTVGCDSIITLNLTIKNSTSSTISASACNSYTWSLNSMTYTTSGSYKDTLMNSVGCDSVVTLNLTIKNSTSSTISVSACNSYTWSLNNMTYTTSGSYKDTLMNSAGCDSIITLNLIINNPTYSNIYVSSCLNYKWIMNNMVYTTSGTYKDTIANSKGCDSIIILNLTINQATGSIINVSSCDIYIWQLNNMTYTSSGTYSHTIQNSKGCDSTVVLKLIINKSTYSTISASACNSYTSPSGNVYTQSGLYNDTITNSKGCDSIITIKLSIKNNMYLSNTISACDQYTSVLGNIYTSSGTYYDTLVSSSGCDSIIITYLTIDHITTDSVSQNGNTLTALQNNATYMWLDCENDYSYIYGSNNQTFTPIRDGNYAVKITFGACIDTSDCIGIVRSGLDLLYNFNLSIYPNPTNSKFNITSELNNELNVEIFDIKGKLIVNDKFIKHYYGDISNQESGIYLIKIKLNNEIIKIEKIVLDK